MGRRPLLDEALVHAEQGLFLLRRQRRIAADRLPHARSAVLVVTEQAGPDVQRLDVDLQRFGELLEDLGRWPDRSWHRSSRGSGCVWARLERETGRNVKVRWLTGRLVPDRKTISSVKRQKHLPVHSTAMFRR